MAASGGKVAIYGAGPQVNRILSMGGILKLVQLFDTKDDALAS